MTTFDKREEAFERQFVHDEGVRFKALARRNKRLGLWAAERLGRIGTEAESYAKVLAAIELQHHSDAEVASKIQRISRLPEFRSRKPRYAEIKDGR